ncbi:MAG: macro domain-containing protein [Methanobrevibacter sp.]|nr:macro domain-containing protein [Methanobrevibacter sp.]
MITIIKGDLFTAPAGLICHQVNCKGNMGRGVAKTFREKYPRAYYRYLSLCQTSTAATLLGTCLFNKEDDNHVSCSMFAQENWHGYDVCNTDYSTFRKCCDEIKEFIIHNGLSRNYQINMPYGIGAGLGSGDWLIIQSILEEEFEGYNLILWKL